MGDQQGEYSWPENHVATVQVKDHKNAKEGRHHLVETQNDVLPEGEGKLKMHWLVWQTMHHKRAKCRPGARTRIPSTRKVSVVTT